MPRYELWESIDAAEVTMTVADDRSRPAPQLDTEGRPMRLVKDFVAIDWDAAKQVRNDHYGWGPYKP